MLKECGHLLQLDEVEKGVVHDFLSLLDEQKFSTKILVLSNRIHRTVEGIIVVPVSLNGKGCMCGETRIRKPFPE
jgi:hypothetical protein